MTDWKIILTPDNCDEFEHVARGEALLDTDLYKSSSGSWQVCPCPGVRNQGEMFYRLKESTDG